MDGQATWVAQALDRRQSVRWDSERKCWVLNPPIYPTPEPKED